MKPLFRCEIDYFPYPHLSQIYDGFEKLRKIGIIDVLLKPTIGNIAKPLLKVKVDNKFTVIYDTLDGFNWIHGSDQDNLKHFKDNTKADYYFKRSYNKHILDYIPDHCKVYPLGLNFGFQPEGKFPKDLKETVGDFIKNNCIVSRFYKKTTFFSEDFEFHPITVKKNMILFIARLWDPDEVELEHSKIQRELINRNRVEYIQACQKEFGKQFTGGLQRDSFSIQTSKDLVISDSLTNRKTFLNAVKEHNICIATTGIHNSIGWKFAEYVAASRAIISEPLFYEPCGDFGNDKNYLIFNNADELLSKVHFLLKNNEAVSEMMKSNFQYYNNYLRPDKLVLNTLLKIYEEN